MTTIYISAGAKLRLPSGTGAKFVRWGARASDLIPPDESADRKFERVAYVDVGGEVLTFSERFMKLVKVVQP